MNTIPIKILGTRRPQRYCIARTLLRAQSDFEREHPDYHLDVQQVSTSQEILQYTPVIAFPSLIIAEKLVCVGRFPRKDEILGWLENETQKTIVLADSQP